MTMMTRLRTSLLALILLMLVAGAAAPADAQTVAPDVSTWQSFTAGNVFVTPDTRTYLLLQNKLGVPQEFEWFYTPHGTTARILRSQTLAAGASASVDLNGDAYFATGVHAFALQVDAEGAADVTVTVHPAGVSPLTAAFWLTAVFIPVRQGPYLP